MWYIRNLKICWLSFSQVFRSLWSQTYMDWGIKPGILIFPLKFLNNHNYSKSYNYGQEKWQLTNTDDSFWHHFQKFFLPFCSYCLPVRMISLLKVSSWRKMGIMYDPALAEDAVGMVHRVQRFRTWKGATKRRVTDNTSLDNNRRVWEF